MPSGVSARPLFTRAWPLFQHSCLFVFDVFRYEIDAEYDADLKARDRWADPLAKAPTSRAKGRETGQEEEVATQHARKQRELGSALAYIAFSSF